ncbi:hypothetical protein PYCC9005_001115 [Savitreella phatthalungensis]
MDSDTLPALAAYRQAVRVREAACARVELILERRALRQAETRAHTAAEEHELTITQLKASITQLTGERDTARRLDEERRREIESLRQRHVEGAAGDKVHSEVLRAQCESYRREAQELRDDLKARDAELRDVRELYRERERDNDQARESVRSKERELRSARETLRDRDAKLRRLELELEAANDRYADLESRSARQQVKAAVATTTTARPAVPKPAARPAAASRVRSPSPEVESDAEAERVDSPAPPAKAVKARKAHAKEPAPAPRRPVIDSDTDTPPRPKKKPSASATAPTTKTSRPVSTPGTDYDKPPAGLSRQKAKVPASPATKRGKENTVPLDVLNSRKPADFSMTPFVNRTAKDGSEGGVRAVDLADIPLSPPTSTSETGGAGAAGQKKKRKLFGGKTLMDDSPAKKVPRVNALAKRDNFGRDLSPLKRPVSKGLML